MLLTRHAELEKDKEYYENKYKHASMELVALKGIREANEKLEANINLQMATIEALEKKEHANNVELQRLRTCETEMNNSNARNKLKEQTIQELLQTKSELEELIKIANENLKRERARYSEDIDQVTGENALLQNEKSLLQAQITIYKEESGIEVKQLNEEKSTMKSAYTDLMTQYNNLSARNDSDNQKVANLELVKNKLVSENDMYRKNLAEKEQKIEVIEFEFKEFKNDASTIQNKLKTKVFKKKQLSLLRLLLFV